MNKSKLADHAFKKGKFYSPWSKGFDSVPLNMRERNWADDAMPEYFWLALIVNSYERKRGLAIAGKLILYLAKTAKTESARLSDIFKLSTEEQKKFYHYCKTLISQDVLCPLTMIFTMVDQPTFAAHFTNIKMTVEERCDKLVEVLEHLYFHQNELATDVRFLTVMFIVYVERISFFQGCPTLEALNNYPITDHADERMHLYRPSIRAAEIGMDMMFEYNKNYLSHFWGEVAKMTKCNAVLKQINDKPNESEIQKSLKLFEQKMYYYSQQVMIDPFNSKLLVLCGIANYSFKRLNELVLHDLYNTASGRSIIRVMIEDYIMMKYLLKHETEHTDIWQEFQYYGIGQYKLVAKRFQQQGKSLNGSHVDYEYIDALVGEFKNEAFIDMDTTYFGKGIREKAIDVGEKDLYDFYYDYDSQFEHGLWGAIRESSLIKCLEVGHQYHDILDVGNQQKLPSVWSDCKSVMDKTLDLLKAIFGLPDGVGRGQE